MFQLIRYIPRQLDHLRTMPTFKTLGIHDNTHDRHDQEQRSDQRDDILFNSQRETRLSETAPSPVKPEEHPVRSQDSTDKNSVQQIQVIECKHVIPQTHETHSVILHGNHHVREPVHVHNPGVLDLPETFQRTGITKIPLGIHQYPILVLRIRIGITGLLLGPDLSR